MPTSRHDADEAISLGELRSMPESRSPPREDLVNSRRRSWTSFCASSATRARYTRLQLLDTVWGYGYDGYEHNVNCHINRLRGKIENDPARPQVVLTVRGVGYKLGDLQPAGAEA